MKKLLLSSFLLTVSFIAFSQMVITPSSGCAGSTFNITITGLNVFTASSACGTVATGGLTTAGNIVLSASLTASGNNAASGTLTIPSGFTAGSYGFKVTAGCNNVITTCSNCFTVLTSPAQPGTITGTAMACSGTSQTYSVTAVAGATSYTWTLPNGWSGTSSSNSINTTTGSNGGTISVTANNTCGSSPPRTLTVTMGAVPAQPGTITGNASVCISTNQTYSVTAVPGATSYTWTLPNGWTGTSTINSITATTGANSGTVSVTANNSCGSSTPRTLAVTTTTVPAQPGTISGTATVCSGASQTYSVTAVAGAASYTWTLPNGWTGTSSSNSITATAGGGSGTVSVTANNTCGSSTPRNLAVTLATTPAQPGNISGNVLVCSGASRTYLVTSVVGATSYTWTLPNGWTGTSSTNSITTTVGTNSGTISVTADNACGSSTPKTLAVTVDILPSAVTVSPGGAISICTGTSQTLTCMQPTPPRINGN